MLSSVAFQPCSSNMRTEAVFASLIPRLARSCSCSVLVALLALATGLAPDAAIAQVRGASAARMQVRAKQKTQMQNTPLARQQRLAELDAWLRRLAGLFDVAGMPTSLNGMEDCMRVGNGPGVHCIRSVGANSYERARPTVVLYGLDPHALGIRYLQVGFDSRAEGDLGKLTGNTATFRSPCYAPGGPRSTTVSCERRIRIHAPPDGQYVRIDFETEQKLIVHGGGQGSSGARSMPPIVTTMWLRRRPDLQQTPAAEAVR